MLLSLVALIPLIAFITFSVDQFAQGLRRIEHKRVAELAESISADIDREAAGLIAVAETLATSPSLAEGSLDLFHAEAREAVRGKNADVVLIDSSMKLLLHTAVAYGSPVPPVGAPETVAQVFASAKPAVSNLFDGIVFRTAVFDVTVPVHVDGTLRYALSVRALPLRISEILKEQHLADGWNAAVLDGKGNAVASTDSNLFTADAVASILRFAGATWRRIEQVDVDWHGQSNLVTRVGSPLSAWQTIVIVPHRVLEAPISDMWTSLAAASLLAITASAFLAYFFSLPFATLIQRLVRSVQHVGRDAPLPGIGTFLREAGWIEESLADTHRQLLSRQRETEESARLVADSERRLRLALSVAKMAIIDAPLGPGATISAVNSMDVLGVNVDGESTETALQRLLEIVDPRDRTRIEDFRRRVLAAPGPFAYDCWIVKPGGEIVWIEAKGESIAGGDGRPKRLIKTDTDITARKVAEQNLRLVSREVTHRAKNLLTVILGIAKQTCRMDESPAAFLDTFSKRIQGLAASHDLLVRSNWSGAPLDELISVQLSPFGGVDRKRISAEGPAVVLRNDVLQSLGLAFHELATNAVKYGALSIPAGHVQITWTVSTKTGEERLRLVWSEHSGPPVKPPRRKGFGHVIMVRHVAHVMQGMADIDYGRDGVVWTVDAPLEAIVPGLGAMGDVE